jgi:flagellar basal-body rod protein FlgG
MTTITSIALSGINVQQNQTQNIASNLANSQTIGYKESYSTSTDAPFYNYIKLPGRHGDEAAPPPVGVYAGSGTNIAGTIKKLSQGQLRFTENPLHIALVGQGYIAANYKGQKAFTRNGQLQISKDRKLQLLGGHDLDNDITIPQNIHPHLLKISNEGVITAEQDGSTITIGQISVYQFNNEQGLQEIGEGLKQQTEVSGDPIENIPGENGAPTIQHLSLEESNVDSYGAMLAMLDSTRITQHLWHILTSAHKNEMNAMDSAYAAASA